MTPQQERDDEIVAALRALAGADREFEAPAEMELRLRAAFRRSVEKRRWQRAAMWTAFAAAAAVVIAMFLSRTPRAAPVRTQVPVKHSAPNLEQPAIVSTASAKAPPKAIGHTQQREIVTDFFPLMDAPPPIDHGELVRVSLPAAAMRTVGLPVREDRLSEPVQADVLVSEDGLATAIRFVKTQP